MPAEGTSKPIRTNTFGTGPGRHRAVFARPSTKATGTTSPGLFFVQGSFNDTRAYAQLKAKLDAVDQQFGIPGSRVFYLAIPPQLVSTCASAISRKPAWSNDPDDADAVHARHRREADRPRPGQRQAVINAVGARRLPKARPIASTTTSARRRSRT